jgi:Helix-turn-helix domain
LTGDLHPFPAKSLEISAGALSEEDFCWGSLVASTIHPVKVAIVEALLWVHAPLSASELAALFGCEDFNLDIVLYHLKGLTRLGVLEVTGTRRIRGARETYLFFRVIPRTES